MPVNLLYYAVGVGKHVKVLVYVTRQWQELITDNDHCFGYAGDGFVFTLAGQDNNDGHQVVRRLTNFFS